MTNKKDIHKINGQASGIKIYICLPLFGIMKSYHKAFIF